MTLTIFSLRLRASAVKICLFSLRTWRLCEITNRYVKGNIYRLELVSQLKSDAPGLGVEVRDIECSIMERALLAEEVQRQVV